MAEQKVHSKLTCSLQSYVYVLTVHSRMRVRAVFLLIQRLAVYSPMNITTRYYSSESLNKLGTKKTKCCIWSSQYALIFVDHSTEVAPDSRQFSIIYNCCNRMTRVVRPVTKTERKKKKESRKDLTATVVVVGFVPRGSMELHHQ